MTLCWCSRCPFMLTFISLNHNPYLTCITLKRMASTTLTCATETLLVLKQLSIGFKILRRHCKNFLITWTTDYECRHEYSDGATRGIVVRLGETNQQSRTPAVKLRDVRVPGQSTFKSSSPGRTAATLRHGRML